MATKNDAQLGRGVGRTHSAKCFHEHVTTHTYYEDLELRGDWWLPESQAWRVRGQLIRNPGNPFALLRLEGDLDSKGTDEDAWPRWPVVWGDCEGIPVTVIDGWATHMTRGMGVSGDGLASAIHRVELRMAFILVGCHLESPTQPHFEQQSLWMEGLTQWANRGTATATWAEDVQYVEQFAWNEHTGQVTVSEQDFRSKWTATGEVTTRVAKGALSLRGPVVSLRESIRLAEKIRGLITFCTLQPSNFERLIFWDQAGKPYDLLSGQAPPTASQFMHQDEMILSLKDAALSQILAGWDRVWNDHESVVAMTLELINDSTSLAQARVVLAVAAAEAFQARLSRLVAMEPEAFDAMLKRIDNALNETDSKWVRTRLKNEQGLGPRLAWLAGGPLEGFIPNLQPYVRDATKARHSLAHGRAGIDLSETTMALVESVTLAVVILRILLVMGLSEDHVWQSVDRNRRMANARMVAEEYYQ